MPFYLKIKDIKDISAFLLEELKIDVSNYTYVSLKIKIEQFFEKYKIINTNLFFEKIKVNPSFKNEFISHLFINEIELFRDPATWRVIKEEVIDQIKNEFHFRAYFPSSLEGSDLLSFLILRDEYRLTDKIEVVYSSKLELINQAKNGFDFEERKHNLNKSNYKRVDGVELSDKYFLKQGNKLVPSNILFENTTGIVLDEIKEVYSKKSNIVIYRNRLLNFNKSLQISILNNLAQIIKPNGYLVLGVKEKLHDDSIKDIFITFNENENIYKRK